MPAFSNGRRKDIHPRRSNTSNSSLLNASFHQARRFPSWQDPSKIPPPDPRRRAAVMGALDSSINALGTPRQIKQFMQDDDYVLWDFSSTAVSPHGMLQVHGGPGVRDANKTKTWLAFVVGFIHLLLPPLSKSL